MLDMDPVARALGYPYDTPLGSFLFDAATGTVVDLPPAGAPAPWGDRRPVLAIGSNAAPQQLAWKLRDVPGDTTVPVLATTLRDHDVVFAAHVASYGSVPATVVPCPGVAVEVKLLLLTAPQHARLDETESVGHVYDVEAIDRSQVLVGASSLRSSWSTVPAYVARAGPLLVDGLPVALEAIRASARTWPAMSQAQVLAHLAAPSGDVEAFIHRVVTDHGFRSDLSARLAAGT